MTYSQALRLLTVQRNQVRYELNYLCTCTTDYFQGSSKPVVQVLVDENTTFQDIESKLLDYIATCHLEDLDTEAYEKAVSTYFEGVSFPATTIPRQLKGVGSMEECDEWDLYMYFVIETLGEDDE